MLVTGGPPVRGGGGMPQRIMVSSRSVPAFADDRRGVVWKHALHGRQVADIPIDDAE